MTMGRAILQGGCHALAQPSSMAVATMDPAVLHGGRHMLAQPFNMAAAISGPTHAPWRSPPWAELSYMAVAIPRPTHPQWKTTRMGLSVYDGGCHMSAHYGGRYNGPSRPTWRPQ